MKLFHRWNKRVDTIRYMYVCMYSFEEYILRRVFRDSHFLILKPETMTKIREKSLQTRVNLLVLVYSHFGILTI